LLPSRYNFLDSGWILETNPLVKMAEGFGMPIYKTHRFYEKRFNSRSDGMR